MPVSKYEQELKNLLIEQFWKKAVKNRDGTLLTGSEEEHSNWDKNPHL